MKAGKYVTILLVLLWGIYFGVKAIHTAGMEKGEGVVKELWYKSFIVSTRRGDLKEQYLAPNVIFPYKDPGSDTVRMVSISPQAYAQSGYKPGDKIGVIFPKGRPEEARFYSFWEYWLPVYNAIILGIGTAVVLMVYFVVRYRPWEY